MGIVISSIPCESVRIYAIHRIVETVGKHIATEEALSRAGEAVRINETADFGVIVAALQVVEFGLLSVSEARTLNMY